MSEDIVPSISIANLVRQRDGVLERLSQAVALIRDAADLAKEAGLGMPRFSVGLGYAYDSRSDLRINEARLGTDRHGARFIREEDSVDEVALAIRRGVDAGAWQFLMSESGLRSMMDAEAREAWDKQLAGDEVPALTHDTVRATFTELHLARQEMFERGVIKCFGRLSWSYATNLPQKFGKRIVVRCITGSYRGRTLDELDDLTRVLAVLDGKPEPDHRRGVSKALSEAGATYTSGRALVETDYLSIRIFKNGNGHITFKRPDLVDKMNLIIAKHYPGALPAPK